MFGKRKYKNSARFPTEMLMRVAGIFVLALLVFLVSFWVSKVPDFNFSSSKMDSLISLVDPIFKKFNVGFDSEDLHAFGQVAGVFTQNIESNISSEKDTVSKSAKESKEKQTLINSPIDVSSRIAIISDIHSNTSLFTSAITKIKTLGISYIIVIGDITDYGTTSSMKEIKNILDNSQLNYQILPGDRDLYQTVDESNFVDVFGTNYFKFNFANKTFVGLDNSKNFTVIDSQILNNFKSDLSDADFVVLSQPLYHPTLNFVMGIVSGEEISLVRAQALEILELIRNSKVSAIISADQHHSSENIDPEDKNLRHFVVGAITDKRNLQTPRFSILTIYENGDFEMRDEIL